MVEAICEGAFFKEGLAVRAHGYLLSVDRDRSSYDPGSLGVGISPDGSIRAKRNESLPEQERVRSLMELHGYVVPALLDQVPESVWSDPDVFFDWVKHTEPDQLCEAVDRLFSLVSIGKRAFQNWVPKHQGMLPKFVLDWPDDLPRDPNHRGPGQFPETELITLCEVVTWLSTGKARPAETLRRLMRRHNGRRWPPGLWRELDEDAQKLIVKLRRGEFPAYGQLEGGPHEVIPNDYFASDVFAEFAKDLIAADPLAFNRDTYPEGLPTYRSVRFMRKDVAGVLADEVRPMQGTAPTLKGAGTAAAETRCFNWLVELMRNGPPVRSKKDYQSEAIAEFGMAQRQFLRAWDNAKADTRTLTWGKAGRRPRAS